MDQNLEALWQALQPMLDTFGRRLMNADPAVFCNIGHFSAGAALFFGYASLFKSAAGEVIEVRLGVSERGDRLALSATACTADGEILAHGPQTQVLPGALDCLREGPVALWLGQVRRFLLNLEPTFRVCIAEL